MYGLKSIGCEPEILLNLDVIALTVPHAIRWTDNGSRCSYVYYERLGPFSNRCSISGSSQLKTPGRVLMEQVVAKQEIEPWPGIAVLFRGAHKVADGSAAGVDQFTAVAGCGQQALFGQTLILRALPCACRQIWSAMSEGKTVFFSPDYLSRFSR